MGRIFEKRKYTMFARFDRMAKAFTRIGREISIAVKQSGPDPANNPRLRAAIQNAKGANMPKDRVNAAIKKASSRDEKDFEEVTYEAYAPHGIAMMIECTTDNPTRTVANVRHILSKHNCSLAATGSVEFMFHRKGVFKISAQGLKAEELELELIDHGAEDFAEDEGEFYVYTAFADFVKMQKALEGKGLNVISAELQRIPGAETELTESQEESVLKLIAALEEDDDVQNVFHNMK
jgi:YebC/PmpR family DNA-binding regulatory protein